MPRRAIELVFAIMLFAISPAFATTIYVAGNDSNLYTIDPTTGATSLIGQMGVEMTDIAILNGAMFGVSFPASGGSALYSIDISTGAATEIGAATDDFLNALQFGPNGTLYAAGGVPGCGPPPQTACDSLFTIDATTGVATQVGMGAYSSSGDLEFIGNTLYLSSLTATSDQLFTIDPSTGAGTLVGDTGFTYIFGEAYVSETGTLYGFNDVGNHVLAIDTNTGAATSVATYSNNFEILGAATNAVPEPRPVWLVFAFAALAVVLARYRRKRSLTRSSSPVTMG